MSPISLLTILKISIVSEMRFVKDSYEISEMRKAVAASVKGFESVAKNLKQAIGHPRGERIVETAFYAQARIDGNGLGYDTIAAAASATSREPAAAFATLQPGAAVPADRTLRGAGRAGIASVLDRDRRFMAQFKDLRAAMQPPAQAPEFAMTTIRQEDLIASVADALQFIRHVQAQPEFRSLTLLALCATKLPDELLAPGPGASVHWARKPIDWSWLLGYCEAYQMLQLRQLMH